MAICAQAVLQPDGSYVLVLDPAVTDVTTCAYVVESGADFGLGSITKLSVTDAQEIAGSCWIPFVVAWGFKKLAQFTQEYGNEKVD
jgi:hypothetical protein